jgi:hypothetical protein
MFSQKCTRGFRSRSRHQQDARRFEVDQRLGPANLERRSTHDNNRWASPFIRKETQPSFNVRLRLLMFAPRFEQLKRIRHSNRSASQSSASGMTCGWYESRRRNALPQMRQS